MRSRFPLLLLTLLSLLLGACTVADNASVESVLEVITIQTTPSLAHRLDEVAACANALPGVGVYAKIVSVSELDPLAADLTIRLGPPLDTDPFVTVLGSESLVTIAGATAPVTSLSLTSLQAIFTGEISNWGNVPEVMDTGLTINEPITVLSYAQGTDLRSHFSEIYLGSRQLSGDARIFSTADTLASLLEENPSAITYALASQVPSTAQILTITGLGEVATEIYLIGIAPGEPDSALRSLLLCIQN